MRSPVQVPCTTVSSNCLQTIQETGFVQHLVCIISRSASLLFAELAKYRYLFDIVPGFAKFSRISAYSAFAGTLLLGLAAPDHDKVQVLAQQRYGPEAAQAVADWRRLLESLRSASDNERLNKVNSFFNRRIAFQNDTEVWGQEDYWATPLELIGRGGGDCEDFAIAKYVTLQTLGLGNDRLRLIYVRYKVGATAGQAHMVLGYYADPSAEPLILDNLVTSVRPASSRPDLAPVFSFNSDGMWVGGAATSSADPTARLSRWRGVLERMRQEGF